MCSLCNISLLHHPLPIHLKFFFIPLPALPEHHLSFLFGPLVTRADALILLDSHALITSARFAKPVESHCKYDM